MPCFGSEKIRVFSFYLLTFICRSEKEFAPPEVDGALKTVYLFGFADGVSGFIP